MSTAKKYNLRGEDLGTFTFDQSFLEKKAHSQMVKDYITAIRANARQWSASTKTRSEVVHTTAKPHKQKGTGRARQGSLVSPQFRGGGIVFGPKPKFDQNVKMNKKEKRSVIHALIAQKVRNNQIVILDSTGLPEPKTKIIANFIDKVSLDRRVLFLGEGTYLEFETEVGKVQVSVRSDKHSAFVKSMRNIPKTDFSLVKNVNGYDLMLADNLVITEAAWSELTEWLA